MEENPLAQPQQDQDTLVQANDAGRQPMARRSQAVTSQLLATRPSGNGVNNYPSLNQSSIELQEFYKSRDE